MIILITGTRKGIGRYLAEYYLDNGNIVIGLSRKSSDLHNINYQHYEADISDEKSIIQIFSEIRKKYKKLDVLINNAGINPSISPLLLQTLEIVKKTFDTNVYGTILMCREAVKLMMKNSYGRIINLSSMAVKHEVEGESVYTSSKASVNSFSRVIAKEIYQLGITCNVIAPSAIETDLMKAVNSDALQEVLNKNVIKAKGNFEDVSNIIDFLIKKESKSITGQIIYLGGV